VSLQDENDIIPWDEQPKPTGQLNYEAFAAALGWKFRGAQLPAWARLEAYEQEAFTAGAHQVIQKGWVQAQPGGTARHRRRT